MKKKVMDPARFRCPSKVKNWCYEVVPSTVRKGRFVVRVKTRGHLVVGFLEKGCIRSNNGRKAVGFKSRKAADEAAQECILKRRRRS